MGKFYFTDEQVNSLKKNQYVKNISNKSIKYTECFKKEFYNQLKNGNIAGAIFEDLGFDINVLGKERIKSITSRIKKEANRPEGFVDTRTSNSGRPRTKDMTKEEYINYLEHKTLLQQQQISALKKISLLERTKRQSSYPSQKKDLK